jgi:hypothetical protein
MLHHFSHTSDLNQTRRRIRGGRHGVREQNSEPEIGLEQGVHHNPVPKLEYLQRQHGAWKENERQWKYGEFDKIGTHGMGWIGGGQADGKSVPFDAGVRG